MRDHIGGNCYDYIDKHGLRCSKYGAHLFHTRYQRVWDYVHQFSGWVPFDHRVKGRVPDMHGKVQLVPIPLTQETVNKLFGEVIQSEEDMTKYYEKKRAIPPNGEPANGEEAALSIVGPRSKKGRSNASNVYSTVRLLPAPSMDPNCGLTFLIDLSMQRDSYGSQKSNPLMPK
jgi:UDP-galactopyranose mutase